MVPQWWERVLKATGMWPWRAAIEKEKNLVDQWLANSGERLVLLNLDEHDVDVQSPPPVLITRFGLFFAARDGETPLATVARVIQAQRATTSIAPELSSSWLRFYRLLRTEVLTNEHDLPIARLNHHSIIWLDRMKDSPMWNRRYQTLRMHGRRMINVLFSQVVRFLGSLIEERLRPFITNGIEVPGVDSTHVSSFIRAWDAHEFILQEYVVATKPGQDAPTDDSLGFAMREPWRPWIFINVRGLSDRMFFYRLRTNSIIHTLLHEMAHLMHGDEQPGDDYTDDNPGMTRADGHGRQWRLTLDWLVREASQMHEPLFVLHNSHELENRYHRVSTQRIQPAANDESISEATLQRRRLRPMRYFDQEDAPSSHEDIEFDAESDSDQSSSDSGGTGSSSDEQSSSSAGPDEEESIDEGADREGPTKRRAPDTATDDNADVQPPGKKQRLVAIITAAVSDSALRAHMLRALCLTGH